MTELSPQHDHTNNGDPALIDEAWSGYKRGFDLAIVGSAHIFLFPLWVVLWVVIPAMVWIGDRGPIFYKQKRVGKDGKIFTVLKFRTMVKNADRLGPAWTTVGDIRITKIGKILRRTALDELPEVISIFRGHMSLVGPRPLDVVEHERFEQLVPGFSRRLKLMPGLTGLAQVYDHTDDASNKFMYDQEYIRRMSPWLDIKLLVMSVLATVFGRWDNRAGKSEAPENPLALDGEKKTEEEHSNYP